MIEILKFEMINKGSLIARFNVKMHKWGGLIIKECSLFHSNDRKWINLPSRQYEVEGKKKYAPYLEYEDREMNDKFKNMILMAAEEQRQKSSPSFLESVKNEEIPF